MPAGDQRRAICPHQMCDAGTDDRHAQLLFKAAQHTVVAKRSTLHDDVRAQILLALGADDLIQRILDDAAAQTGRDVFDRRSVLLRLFDTGIHEYRTAGPQIDRMLCLQAQLCKFRSAVSQALRKCLDERTAAAGARLVEDDIIDAAIADLETLDVLTADVEYVIHIRIKVFCGLIVRHRLYGSLIQMEGMPHQLFAITGRTAAGHLDAVAPLFVNLLQVLQHDIQRTALVGGIRLIQQLLIFSDQDQFGRGGTAVHPQVHVSLISGQIAIADIRTLVTLHECFILFFGHKERLALLFLDRHVLERLQLAMQFLISKPLAGA